MELFEQITTAPPLHSGPVKRVALFALAKWWSASHPSDKCKRGAQRLVALFDAMWWPENAAVAPEQLLSFEVSEEMCVKSVRVLCMCCVCV